MDVVGVVENDQDMEPSENGAGDADVEAITARNEATMATNIVKGKRTKRQRPQSPIPFRMQVPLASAEQQQEGGNAAKSEEASSDICSNVQASTEEECRWGGSTEEEEEIANCLILLAQGQPLEPSSSASGKPQAKFTSRKFLETPHGSKAGYYVYECKTCFKTFPSFQALGGHRASHMRPKKDDGPETTKTMSIHHYSLADDPEHSYNHAAAFRASNNPSLNSGNKLPNLCNNIETELGGNNNNIINGKRQRVHRCSTCGAEFSSGQALGGHMRRHRGPVGGGPVGGGLFGQPLVAYHDHRSALVLQQSSPALSFTRLPNSLEGDHLEACKFSLDLDLNLPAPPDQDDQSRLRIEPCRVEGEEGQGAEQPRLMAPLQHEESPVLIPPSLVDCHD